MDKKKQPKHEKINQPSRNEPTREASPSRGPEREQPGHSNRPEEHKPERKRR